MDPNYDLDKINVLQLRKYDFVTHTNWPSTIEGSLQLVILAH